MEKVYKYGAIGLALILAVVLIIGAIQLGQFRQTITELERRNSDFVLSNSQYAIVLDSIAGRISEAQKTLAGTGDTISRIRGLVDAIERISQDLRKLAPQN